MPLTVAEVEALFDLPFNDLVFKAQSVHRQHFDPNAVQLSTLLSVKTGGCPEDCGYCSQSAHFKTAIETHALMPLEKVLEVARNAKARGASRFCMAAAWRGPRDKDLDKVADMVRAVKEMGLETCVTLGMLRQGQAEQLKDAGLDYYNHNLDTSREHYEKIIHTHTYDDRLDTLQKVRQAGIKVCCGGIMGMGESRRDRAAFIAELTRLDPAPESVPINLLARVAGTPLADVPAVEPIEFVRTIAVTRIAMPTSMVRLSAGRTQMPAHLQALCFLAGANSIFYGEKLLTTPNPAEDSDAVLFEQLGLQPMEAQEAEHACAGAAIGG